MAVSGAARTPRYSVAKAISLALMATTTLVLAALGFFDFQREAQHRALDLDAAVSGLSEQMSHSLALPLWNYDVQQIESILEGVMRSNRAVYAIVVRDAHQDKDLVLRGRDDQWRSTAAASDLEREGLLLVATEIVHQGSRIGAVEVWGTDRFEREALRSVLFNRIVSILTVNLLLVGVLYLVFRRTVVLPLRSLEAYALQVSQGAPDARISGPGFLAEFASLHASIEQMVGQLEARYNELSASKAAQSQAEERFRSIFMNATEGIYQTGLDGAFLTINPALARIFKYDSPEDFLSHVECADHLYADPADRTRFVDLLLAEGHVDNFVAQFRLKDGSLAWHELNAHLVKDETGKTLYSEGTIQDVTERKRAEEALRTSEERFRTLVEQSQDSIQVHDPTGRLLLVNERGCEVLGYSREELLSMSVPDIDPDFLARNDPETIWNSLPQTFESRHRRKDGSTFPVQIRLSKIIYADQEVFFAAIQDITERKRAEMIMQARLRLMQFSYEHSHDELLTAAVNEAEMLTDSQVGFFHFLNPDQKTLTFQAWSTRTTGEMCRAEGTGEHYCVDKAGVWVECIHTRQAVIHNDYAALPHKKGLPPGHAPVIREMVVPVFRQGQIVAILGLGNKPTDYADADIEAISLLADMAWSIAERKRAVEALRVGEERFRALVEQSQDGIFLHDLTGRMLLVNQRACDSLGYSHEELLALSVPDFDPDFPAHDAPQTTWISLPQTFESRHKRKDGSMFPVEVRLSKIVYADQQMVLAAVQDITERKRAEEALRQSRDELAANQNKLSLAMALAEMGTWECDRNANEFIFNDQFYALYGTSCEREGGARMSAETYAHDFLPTEEIPLVAAALAEQSTVAPQTIFSPIEHRIIRRDGAMRTIRVHYAGIWDESGRLLRTYGANQDITELKRTEEALRKSRDELATNQRMLSLAMDLANMGAWKFDAESGQFIFNDQFYALYGTSCEREGGARMSPETYAREFLPSEDAHLLWNSISKGSGATSDTVMLPVEHRIIRRGGEVRDIIVHFSGAWDESGQLVEMFGATQDITERKRAVEALRENRRLLQSILNTVPESIFWKDRQSVYQGCNKAFAYNAGLDNPQDIVGKTDFDLPWLSEESEAYRADDRQVMATRMGKLNYVESQMQPDGRHIWIQTSKLPLLDDSGEAKGVMGTYQDITDRKRAEEALFVREQEFRALAENSPDMIVRFNRELRRTYVNAAWERGTRLTRHEALGEIIGENSPLGPGTKRYVGSITQVLETGSPCEYDLDLPRGQETLCLSVRMVPELNQGGEITSVLVIGHDITERKRAEEALQASEERFRAFMDNSPAFGWMKDEAGRYVYMNRAYLDYYGLLEEDSLGKTDFERRPEELAQEYWDNDRAVLDFGRTIEVEEPTPGPNGEHRIWRSYKFLVADPAGRRFVGGIALDITERKLAEEALRENRRVLASVLDTVPESIFWKDRQSVYQGCNKAFAYNAGLDNPQDIVGKTDFDLPWLPEESSAYRADDNEVMTTRKGKLHFVEQQWQHDGSHPWVETCKLPILDESGEAVGVVGTYKDITERKQAETALQASRDALAANQLKLTIAMELAHMGAWEYDFAARLFSFDDQLFSLFGTTCEREGGNLMSAETYAREFLPPEAIPLFLARGEALRNPAPDTAIPPLEHRIIRRDGAICDIVVSSRLLWDEKGRVKTLVGATQDITERKRAETELYAREQEFRTLIENSPDLIIRYDRGLRRIYANPASERVTGVKAQKLLGKTLAELSVLGSETQRYQEALREVLDTKTSRDIDINMVRGAGSASYSCRMVPEYDQSGAAVSVMVIGRDITDRKRAEAELYAREQEFRTLAENSPDMIVRFDRKLRRIFVNPAWERGTGLSGQDAQGKTLAQVSPLEREATDRYVGNIRQVLETGDPCEYDLDITRGQETTSVSVRMVPEFDQEGMVGSVLVIGRDITERKRAEEALRASEERLRKQLDFLLAQGAEAEAEGLSSILEAPAVQSLYDEFVHLTGAPIGLIDVQGKVLVNAGWQDICSKFHRVHPETLANCVESDTRLVANVKPGEFFAYKCRNNMWDVATPLYIGDRHVANLFTGQFFYEDETVDLEMFMAQADRYGFDREAYLEAVRRVPRFSRAKVEAVMEFLVKLAKLLSTLGSGNLKLTRALWDQKQIEQDLRESQLRHKEVFDHSEDGILLTDITPEGQFRIAEVNPAGEEMLGISRQDAVGRLLQDALPPDVAGRISKNYGRCIDHGAPLHFEEEVHTAAGVKFLQRTQTPLRDHSGRICRIFSLARDITARRQAEASLRTSEKMNALGTLAGGIAHDFNNILGSVANLAALARGEIPPDSAARKDLDRILESTNVGKELVNQILAFCRLGKGSSRVFDPAKVTRSVLDILKLSIPANLILQDDISGASGQILGDPSQFHQIVLNLCSNAVDAMRGDSGVLRVSLGAETLGDAAAAAYSLSKAGGYVALKVADTGPGIPQDVLSRIFEPFFTTKPKGRGTGLGLAVVHGVVSRHQGAVVVDTHPGQGTTFMVYVPVHEAEELLPQLAAAEPLHGVGRILLVDDDEVLLSSGKRLLEGLGYTVSACTGGDEALALFRAAPASIDLLITDLSMPCLNGKELALGALAIRPSLPIILCTGFGEALSPEEAKRIGIREYVHKPVNWNSLSVAIKGLLSNVVE